MHYKMPDTHATDATDAAAAAAANATVKLDVI